MVHHDKTTEISTLFALFLRCPFSFAAPKCQLAEYRNQNISVEDKFNIAEKISQEERHRLLTLHQNCLESRLSSMRLWQSHYHNDLQNKAKISQGSQRQAE